MDFTIDALDLLFPARMSPRGLAFVTVHGIDHLSLSELRPMLEYLSLGSIKVRHRCQHLLDDGRCAIYSQRPEVCRQFPCASRHDCACGGHGRRY